MIHKMLNMDQNQLQVFASQPLLEICDKSVLRCLYFSFLGPQGQPSLLSFLTEGCSTHLLWFVLAFDAVDQTQSHVHPQQVPCH